MKYQSKSGGIKNSRHDRVIYKLLTVFWGIQSVDCATVPEENYSASQ